MKTEPITVSQEFYDTALDSWLSHMTSMQTAHQTATALLERAEVDAEHAEFLRLMAKNAQDSGYAEFLMAQLAKGLMGHPSAFRVNGATPVVVRR